MGKKEFNYVRFDVGHHLHVCHKSTILKYQDSFLAKLLAPEYDKREQETDYIVIDRDGKHFGSILNFLRDQTLDLENWSLDDLTDLMKEADFYCLVDLVELCEKQFELRSQILSNSNDAAYVDGHGEYIVPSNRKIEIVYGVDIVKEILRRTKRPAIVINWKNIRRYHIDGWIEELIRISDPSRFRVHAFTCKQENLDKGFDFIMSVWDPQEAKFLLTVSAPANEKFAARRRHYKCKIFKFWFLVQNDLNPYRHGDPYR